jgi:hypothetical protein
MLLTTDDAPVTFRHPATPEVDVAAVRDVELDG